MNCGGGAFASSFLFPLKGFEKLLSLLQPHQKPHPYHSQFYSSNPGPGGLNKSTIIIVTNVNSPEYFCEFLGLEKHFSLKKKHTTNPTNLAIIGRRPSSRVIYNECNFSINFNYKLN